MKLSPTSLCSILIGNTIFSGRLWLKTSALWFLAAVVLAIVTLAACKGTPARRFSTDEQREIRAMLTNLHENGQFYGSILVARRGVVIYRDGLGSRPETPSNLASVSKQFTATAIMMLKERGKIGYDDPIVKYLPELAQTGTTITVRHLLTHTSGISDVGDLGIDHPGLKESEVLNAVMQQYKQFANPGEKYRYSNTGYILLAMIVERVTGTSLNDFLAQNIFSPLGMDSTRLNARRSYTKGDGGISSTVDDLLKWDQALYTDKLVKQTTLNEAFTPAQQSSLSVALIEKITGKGYGFGWNIAEKDGEKFVWHTGNDGNSRAFIGRLLGERLFIAILTKGQSPRVEICNAIVNILHEKPYTMPKLSIEMKLLDAIKSHGIEGGIQEYHRLKSTQPETFDFTESALNSVGYQLLNEGKGEAAIRVFQLNTKEFPASSNTYDSLGEAYKKTGQRELAIQAYRKAVELDPNNLNAHRMLKSLE